MKYYKKLPLLFFVILLVSCLNKESPNEQIMQAIRTETNFDKLSFKLMELKFIKGKQFTLGSLNLVPFEGKLLDQKIQFLIISKASDKTKVNEIIGQFIKNKKDENLLRTFTEYFKDYKRIEKDGDITFMKNDIEITMHNNTNVSGNFTFDIKRDF